MATSTTLSAFAGDHFHDETVLRSIVGALQNFIMTRPNIAFAINKVYQSLHYPTTIHWQAVKHTFHYLNHSINEGLLIRKLETPHFQAFSNVDWVSP